MVSERREQFWFISFCKSSLCCKNVLLMAPKLIDADTYQFAQSFIFPNPHNLLRFFCSAEFGFRYFTFSPFASTFKMFCKKKSFATDLSLNQAIVWFCWHTGSAGGPFVKIIRSWCKTCFSKFLDFCPSSFSPSSSPLVNQHWTDATSD